MPLLLFAKTEKLQKKSSGHLSSFAIAQKSHCLRDQSNDRHSLYTILCWVGVLVEHIEHGRMFHFLF